MIRTKLIEWRESLPKDINYQTYSDCVSEQLLPADQSAAIALFSATNRQAMLTILVAMSNFERHLADNKKFADEFYAEHEAAFKKLAEQRN